MVIYHSFRNVMELETTPPPKTHKQEKKEGGGGGGEFYLSYLHKVTVANLHSC